MSYIKFKGTEEEEDQSLLGSEFLQLSCLEPF